MTPDEQLLRAERVIERVKSLVESPEATTYRDEATRHVVAQPYADNRYVRLLDAIRDVVRDA